MANCELHLREDGQRGRREGGQAPGFLELHARKRGGVGHAGRDVSVL